MDAFDLGRPGRRRRHECKYEIPEDLALEVRDAVRPHVVPDPHALGRAADTYPISSLYFDTPELTLYRETADGDDRRFKLRIRAYDDEPDHPVFLEIKRRRGVLVEKSRSPVLRRDLACLVPDDIASREPLDMPASIDPEFLYRVYRLGARPRVVVRYDRQAYVGAIDDQVRVTFDRDLRYLVTDSLEIPVASRGFQSVPRARVVLELKFNDAFPFWLQVLVHHFRLERRSFSKYRHSIEAQTGVSLS